MSEFAQALRDKTAVCATGLLLGDFPGRTVNDAKIVQYGSFLGESVIFRR